MDAFESLIALLLSRKGYWTQTSFKVELTKADKRAIGRPSSPRWELDIVAYKGADNEVLAIECKSYLDSPGVRFDGRTFVPAERYKLFVEPKLRRVVLGRLGKQLAVTGACRKNPKVRLCLAVGKIAKSSDVTALEKEFLKRNWQLFDETWIRKELECTSRAAYENDVAHVVSKLLLRKGSDEPV